MDTDLERPSVFNKD
jgi:hypothetical protein